MSSTYYPDVPLFLILIPFISAFNYYLTYTDIKLNGFLLLTFTIDTVQGYLGWLGARYFILYLDKKRPYSDGTTSRIAIQLAGTALIGLFIISILTELVSWIARGRPAPLHFYTRDLFIIGIWFFVINGIYIGLHYYREWRELAATRERENQARTGGIVVKHGRQDNRLAYAELSGFFVDEHYVIACHTNGKKYYLDQSLDKIEKGLPDTLFFRLNRQYIVHRQLVSGFKREENGKLLVLLQASENFPPSVAVSRTKAPAFKRWFRPE